VCVCVWWSRVRAKFVNNCQEGKDDVIKNLLATYGRSLLSLHPPHVSWSGGLLLRKGTC